jgi:hypothetical protein
MLRVDKGLLKRSKKSFPQPVDTPEDDAIIRLPAADTKVIATGKIFRTS